MKIRYLLSLFCILMLQAQDERENRVLDLTAEDFSDFPVFGSTEDIAIKFFSINSITEELYIQRGKDYKRIQSTEGALSRTHFYDVSRSFVLYRKVQDEAGEVVYRPVVEAQFPANSKDVVVAIMKKQEQYRVFCVDMSLQAQSLGSARFVNLTTGNLFVLLNDKQGAISPGDSISVSFDTSKTHFFNFKIAVQNEGEARLIFTKRYPFRGQTRRLYIGYLTRTSGIDEGPFRVYSYTDAGPDQRPLAAGSESVR